MSNVLDLFKDNIEDVLVTQYKIDKIESRETDIKLKKEVLFKAFSKSDDSFDKTYFKSEIELLIVEEKELSVEKSGLQRLHKDLVRRVDILKQVSQENDQA